MIKLEEIGKEYTVKYNNMMFTVTIKNDPSQYKYYKTLGLDVFEEKPKKKSSKKKPEVENDSTDEGNNDGE